MNTKTTIITLAALSLGVAATQAGRGNTLIVPGAPSQTQNASHAVHTFNLGDNWSYKIKGFSYTLETIDASSPGTLISVTSKGKALFDMDIPLVRKVPKTKEIVFDPPIVLSGNNLDLVFAWQHGASAFGSIAVNAEVTPNAPEVTGELITPAFAVADAKPTIGWNAAVSVTTKTYNKKF